MLLRHYVKLYLVVPTLMFSINTFAYTIFGNNVSQVLSDTGENVTNFINGITTFDAASILAKRDEINQKIRERKQENNIIISNGSPLALEREREERERSNCNIHNLREELELGIKLNCGFDEIDEFCDYVRVQNSNKIIAITSKMRSLTGNNIINRLKVFYNEINTVFNESQLNNQACLDKFSNQVSSPKCSNTYESVFNNAMTNYLKFNCTEEDVTSAVGYFISVMRNPDIGIGVRVKQIQESYGKSRAAEAGLAVIKANIEDTIIEWEAKNNRIPSTTNSEESL